MKKICILFLAMISLFVCSCEQNTDSITRQKELESISVEVIDNYFFLNSKEIDYNKILLFGHYSDGSTILEDASLAKYEHYDTSKPNSDLIVTAKYKGKQTDFHIIVGDVRQEKIWIKNYPKKLIYSSKTDFTNTNTLNLDGLEVWTMLEDGNERKLKQNEYGTEVEFFNDLVFVRIYSIINPIIKTYYQIYLSNSDNIVSVTPGNVPDRKYNIGNTIDFTGTSIQVCFDDGSLMTLKDGQWYTGKRIVYEQDIVTDIEVTVQHGKTIWDKLWNWFFGKHIITTLVYTYPINCIINDFVFPFEFPITYKELNKIQFIKKNEFPELYEGNEIIFSNTDICNFKRVYGETETNNVADEEYKDLKYTVDDNITFDNANTMDTPFKFNEFGLQTVYFYYKPEDATKTFKCSYDFWVHDAKFEDIDVTLNTKKYMPGKNYFAKGMDVKDCIIIKRKMSNGIINSPTIPAERCEIKLNKKVDETDDVITYKYIVTYLSENGDTKTQSIDIPFENEKD